MFEIKISPRFSETDALGHISNTALPIWFEAGRQDVFTIFTPNLEIETWPLILARFEVDFLAQTYYGKDVLIKTGIARLGNSSLNVYQEAWQNQTRVAKGLTTLVHFDYQQQKATLITDKQREQLNAHVFTGE